MSKKNNSVDMTNGPFLKKIIVFAIPLILTGLLQCLYNAADLVVVGQFNDETAVGAIASTSSLTNLILGLFMGLSVGSGVCVAHHIGANEGGDVKKVLHTSVLLSLILGAIVSVLGFIFAEDMLRLMDSPENILPQATLYMKIIFLGVPGSMLYNYLASMLRSAGDSKHPLIFLAISGVVNVCLNIIFVTACSMSVDGVAIATVVSQYLSAIMALVYLMRSNGVLRFSFKDLRLTKSKVFKLLYIGVPSGLQSSLFSLSNVIIQSSINGFGDAVVSGSGAAANIEGFVYIAMNSIYHVALTFIGQNVGAKKFTNIRRLTVYCCIIVTVIGLLCGGTVILLGHPLVKLYVSSDAAISAAMSRLMIIMPTYFICGLMDTLCGTLRALDRSVTAMIVSLCGACGLRILWIVTIFQVFPTPESIYISYPISWGVTALFHLLFAVLVARKLIRSDASTKVNA